MQRCKIDGHINPLNQNTITTDSEDKGCFQDYI